jgi:prepilin-type N-terminal cleavage/methylation domain-containing protein
MRRRRRKRGFTLVEVAVTVVIIGILAVIAVVAYRRKIAASRVAEASHIINAIRRGQEEYKAEKGVYANISATVTSFYPNATPNASVTQWGGPCSNCAGGDQNAWQKIKLDVNAPVLFGYSATAGIGPTSNGDERAMNMMGSSSGGGGGGGGRSGDPEIDDAISSQVAVVGPTDPVFVAFAEADADANGVKCHVLGLSHSNHIVVTNEGE